MLEIGGVEYTIDLDALDALITSKPHDNKMVVEKEFKQILDEKGELIGSEAYTKEYERLREIDMAKYETIRVLFEVILSTNEEVDDDLGVERGLGKLPLPFKLSFNTLINYGIIKEI